MALCAESRQHLMSSGSSLAQQLSAENCTTYSWLLNNADLDALQAAAGVYGQESSPCSIRLTRDTGRLAADTTPEWLPNLPIHCCL